MPFSILPRLLARTDADHLAISGIAYRVRLGILQRYGRNLQIPQSVRAEFLVLGDHIREQVRIDLHVVSTLLQRQPEDRSGLDCVRLVFVHVESQHTVIAALLLAQNVQCFWLVAGRDNTVRDLAADDSGGDHIADICTREEFRG